MRAKLFLVHSTTLGRNPMLCIILKLNSHSVALWLWHEVELYLPILAVYFSPFVFFFVNSFEIYITTSFLIWPVFLIVVMAYKPNYVSVFCSFANTINAIKCGKAQEQKLGSPLNNYIIYNILYSNFTDFLAFIGKGGKVNELSCR